MKNIIFDIGMVLIDFHWRTTMQKLGIPENVIDIIHYGTILISMTSRNQSSYKNSRN